MGTNYFAFFQKEEEELLCKPCKACGQYTVHDVYPENEGGYHIGKVSYAWRFLFNTYPELGLTNKAAWEAWLKDKVIKSQHRQVISHEEFFTLVESMQDRKFIADAYNILDEQGYRIATRKFRFR